MDERDSIDELHQLAEYRRAIKLLRNSGWGAIVFGLINAVIAFYWIQQSLINIILLAIVLALLVVGLWEVLLPTAEAIIMDGIVAILIGLWDIFVTILNIMAGAPPSVFWGVFGGFIISWGVYRFISYRRLSEALAEKPEPEAIKRFDKVVEQIKKAKPANADDIIGFRVGARFMKPQQDYKGQLGEHAAIFIDKRGHDIMVGHKDDVIIKVKGKV